MELISFSGKHANGSKVILEKSDVVIERGYEGRYQPLPEARSEWMPLIISSNKGRLSSNGFKRLSRSMESFSGVDAAARLKDGANEVTIKYAYDNTNVGEMMTSSAFSDVTRQS